MTRRFNPRIFIDEYDSDILHKAGFGKSTVGAWRRRTAGPERRHQTHLNQLLGRDVLQPKPVGTSRDVDDPQVAPLPPAPYSIPHRHIEINPCVDDGVCLATRKAAMRPVANTLLDARRMIPCMNCKEGIRRAKAEATTRKPTHGEGPRICADPDCSTVLSYGAKGIHCRLHANRLSGRRRAA